MNLYIVKYCANECDDLGYDSPYPIYYSLNENRARNFFEMKRVEAIDHFNEFINKHPQYQNNEDYCIEKNSTNELEYNMGKWFYRYEFCEDEMDTDLRWKNYSAYIE